MCRNTELTRQRPGLPNNLSKDFSQRLRSFGVNCLTRRRLRAGDEFEHRRNQEESLTLKGVEAHWSSNDRFHSCLTQISTLVGPSTTQDGGSKRGEQHPYLKMEGVDPMYIGSKGSNMTLSSRSALIDIGCVPLPSL